MRRLFRPVLTRALALLVVCSTVLVSGDDTFGRTAIIRNSSGQRDGGAGVVQGKPLIASDLTCAGMFQADEMGSGPYTPTYPTALRRVDGVRNYYQLDGSGKIWQWREPALVPCSAPISSGNVPVSATDWGVIPTPGAGDAAYVPPARGGNSSLYFGFKYDEPTGCLIASWVTTYSNTPYGTNSFMCVKFNGKGLVRFGCWALGTRTGQPMGGTGVVDVPSWFVHAYLPAGRRWGVGLGGYMSSVGSGNSLGPSIEAIAPPNANDCRNGVNTPVNAGTVLMRYPLLASARGPTCSREGPTPGLGCTPTTRPVAPYPAKTAFTGYSLQMYTTDWD